MVSDLSKKASNFLPISMILAVLFLWIFFIKLRILSFES